MKDPASPRSPIDHAPIYPLTAIVGQEAMTQALVLALVHPGLGGVLLRGHRGTAKSTAARGLAQLMPPQRVVAGCRFACAPEGSGGLCDECRERRERGERLELAERRGRVVDLPLGTTEDRLLGALDLEAALTRGERRFEPGLLARANGAILYVDEVNLLADHLVDLLLDVAATGVNRVEREGLSLAHPSRFVLIGTMNPEEGDLRPQLLDRFGLCVEVRGSRDLAERVEISRRRLEFESDPAGFAARWAEPERRLRERIIRAQRELKRVTIPEDLQTLASRLALGFEVEGHRADLTMLRAATAICALDGRREVTRRDLGRAAELALSHRVEDHGLPQGKLDEDLLEELLAEPSEEPGRTGATRGTLKKKTATS